MPLDVWQPQALEGVQLTAYEGRNRTFPPTLLTGFNFGVRLAGVRETTYRQKRFRSGPGTFLAYRSGVGLAAKPVSGDTWCHKDMSLSAERLQSLLGPGVPLDNLTLEGLVARHLNETLFTRFLGSHASLRQNAPRLEVESKLLAWLTPLVEVATGEPLARIKGKEPHAVALVKDYLHTHLDASVGLNELGDLVGLSKNHLTRVFWRETGLTPYQYHAGLRLARVKRLLAEGVSPAQVALEVGLYDQSALNRLIKRHTYLTPKQYQNAVLGKS